MHVLSYTVHLEADGDNLKCNECGIVEMWECEDEMFNDNLEMGN